MVLPGNRRSLNLWRNNMSELFGKITKDDLKDIAPAVQQTLKLLYDDLSLTRINVVRSLIISLSNTLIEWNEAEKEILSSQIKNKETLDKNLMDRYIANHVAATLLFIDGMDDTVTMDQRKRVIKNMLKVIERADSDEPEKKIIL